MRLIDADALIEQIKNSLSYKDYEWSMYADEFTETLDSAPTIEAVYICNRKRCDNCSPECDFTRDINYAGTTDKVFVIDNAPTIEIVRCKDCKYWIDNSFEDDDLFRECRWRDEENTDADDYCSYGERKESER